jgi:DNA polymerase III sliding clamp (beta) subunit (PCNA family)
MKVVIGQDVLARGLGYAAGSLARVSTLAYLQDVLLEANMGGTLVVKATNLEGSAYVTLPATVETAGLARVPAALLISWLGNCLPGPVTLYDKGNLLYVRSGKSEGHFAMGEPGQFPEIQANDGGQVMVDTTDFVQAAKRTTYAAAPKASGGYIQTGVKIWLQGETLELAALDGRRVSLARCKISQRLTEGDVEALVPAWSLDEVARVAKDFPTLSLGFPPGKVSFSLSGENGVAVDLLASILDGKMADYTPIVTATKRALVELKLVTATFLRSLTAVDFFAAQSNHLIRLDVADDILTITARGGQAGSGEETLDVHYDEALATVHLNCQYLKDAVRNLGSERVVLRIVGPRVPVAVTPDDESAVAVLAPMADPGTSRSPEQKEVAGEVR